MSHPFQDLYDRIPAVACKGHCGRERHNSCCGPIGCTLVEAELLEGYLGITSEWIVDLKGAVMMDFDKMPFGRICPHLGLDGRCKSYPVRPLICRLWGTVPRMKCPWGCQPERWLTDVEAGALLAEADRRSRKIEQQRIELPKK